MSGPTVVVMDAPDQQTVDLIQQGLGEYNIEQAGLHDRRAVAVLAKDEAGKTLGGVLGRTSLGLLFLDTFYLPKAQRGAGLGSRILAAAEEEGRKRGCRAAVLYTISFQAPDFYKRHGWRVFGEIPCDPPGTSRIFMTKELRP
jgi:GNAT superfamily N-acetyltransferase